MFDFKKIICTALVIVILVVTSGLGVLAFPKDTQAIWDAILKTSLEQLQAVIVGALKAALLTMLRRSILSWAAGQSDFPLWPDNWGNFMDQLAGTAFDDVFRYYFGFSLCQKIRINLILAIWAAIGYGYGGPAYADVNGCKFTEIMDNLSDIEVNAYWDLSFQLAEDTNDLSFYLKAVDTIRTAQDKKTEITLGLDAGATGFLGQVDCSIDRNFSGRIEKPEDCVQKTPGIAVQQIVASDLKKNEAIANSQFVGDLFGILTDALGVYIDTFIVNSLAKVSGSYHEQGGSQVLKSRGTIPNVTPSTK